jgi:hypothetical protein
LPFPSPPLHPCPCPRLRPRRCCRCHAPRFPPLSLRRRCGLSWRKPPRPPPQPRAPVQVPTRGLGRSRTCTSC